MLDTHLNRKEEAEHYYRRAIAIESRHAFALYNLAVLLEERFTNNTLTNKDNDDNIADKNKLISLSSSILNSSINDNENSIVNKVINEKKEILSLYERAVEADPKDHTTLADYGRYCCLIIII